MKKFRRLASIDIGTNSTRLLVADCDGSMTGPVDRRMVITRLGEGVDKTGSISPEASNRVAVVLEEYSRAIGQAGADRVIAAATSVVRDCSNAGELLERAEGIIGVQPLVLSGEAEGRISFLGAASDLKNERAGGKLLIFDIGGGSTELIVGNAPGADSDGACLLEEAMNSKTVSVNVGCVRMSERFLKTDPPSPVSIGRMESHIVNELKSSVSSLMSAGDPATGIALAGTATTVSAINMGLDEYDAERIHHSSISRAEVESIFMQLASVGLEERKQVMGLEPGRADVIIGGMAVLRTIMDLCGLDEVMISEKDILDGLIINLYHNSSIVLT
ncbi:MAG: Ppx/GppA family phosphatase [Actinobacteria bacterium]|nr:Ppx/GppA family phosphatase [Actinomycetota bacterium]